MRGTTKIAIAGTLAVVLFSAGGIGVLHNLHPQGDVQAAAQTPAANPLLTPAGGALDVAIANLQQRLIEIPNDWKDYASLGLAYVQEARVTQDPTYYPKAEGVLDRSMRLQPHRNEGALVGLAALAAARHDFAGALSYGERAKGVDPYDANVYGVIGDAQNELGDYPEAFATFQKMVDTLPGLSSYARVSYARELQGDVAGALSSMERARQVAGSPADVAWASYQVGDLYFNSGRIDQAEAAYRYGSEAAATYVPNFAGLAKVAWARGDLQDAIHRYTEVTQRYPSPEYVIALGDLYRLTGDRENAQRQFDLVRAEAKLFRANGVNVDLELALFDSDHGDPAAGLQAARAEWGRRHSILVADARAWALYANGEYRAAAGFEHKAMKLGTQNALFFFHAGMIQLRLGHRDVARTFLQQAVAINPHFSIQHAGEARDALDRLGGSR